MTLFFNLNNLSAESCNDDSKFIKLLYNHYTKKLPPRTVKRKLTGLSFLLNPGPLFTKSNVDILYKIQYIKLAALRDYAMYKLYGLKTLDLSYYPDINTAKFRSNPLLKIENDQIYFLYEEQLRKT